MISFSQSRYTYFSGLSEEETFNVASWGCSCEKCQYQLGGKDEKVILLPCGHILCEECYDKQLLNDECYCLFRGCFTEFNPDHIEKHNPRTVNRLNLLYPDFDSVPLPE